jgi:hypothetical protein
MNKSGRHGRKRRIRFRDAVPVWRDRRDLRRQFQRSARATTAERKAEMTALLQRLSARRVPLAEITPGPHARDGVIEFLDGTQLLLVTRRGSASMKRFGQWHSVSRAPVLLIRTQPSFTRRRFRLWFTSANSTKPAEVVAEVRPVPAGAFR